MTTEQFDLLLNVSASVLLAALLLALVASTVLLYLTWSGLRAARRNMPGFLADLDEALGELESAAYDNTTAALRRSIKAISAWQGLKAGLRVLTNRSGSLKRPAGDLPPPV